MCNDFAMDDDFTVSQLPPVAGPSRLIDDVTPHPNTYSPLAPHGTTPLSVPSSPYTAPNLPQLSQPMHPPSSSLLSEDQLISMPLEQSQTSRSQQRRHRQKVTTKPAASLDAETGFIAARDVMGPTSTAHEETEWHRDLGFYDDPSDFDDLHNDPLAHTSPIASEDEDELSTTTPPLTPVHAHEVREMSHSQEYPTSYPAPRPLCNIYLESHQTWWARIIISLVAFLHTKHRLSFRGCALILFSLNAIFTTLGLLPDNQTLPVTLNTVIHRLDLDDRFTIYPVCKNCHRVFPIDIAIDALCPDCTTRLFKPISDGVFRRITGR
jgi:hypothetical protein